MPRISLLEEIDPKAKVSDGATVWNVTQLQAAVNDWIAKLDKLDVRVVAFDLPNGLEWVALDIALLESSRVAVPIPSFFSDQQRQHALATSGAEILVEFQTRFASEVYGLDKRCLFRGVSIARQAQASGNALPACTAIVTYTSGSTGTPKGVCLSAETLLQTARSIVDALRDEGVERHLSVLPLSLLLENTAGLFANLLNGSEVHVPNLASIGIHGSSDVSVTEFVQGIEAHAPNSVILVPALLLGITAAAEFDLATFPSLKFVAVGGGRVSLALLERAATQGLPVFEGYGLTECGSVVAMNTPAHRKAGTVGKLLPHVTAHVRDDELIVDSPTMLGVLGESEEHSAAVATGDRTAFDAQGYLSIHGRIKNTFITAFGRNISPEWVESELQTELSIAYAMVFGEAAETNTALIVARGEASDAELDAAIEQCNQRLPDYARIGVRHRLSLDDLKSVDALTGNGRIKRAAVEHAFQHLIHEPSQGMINS